MDEKDMIIPEIPLYIKIIGYFAIILAIMVIVMILLWIEPQVHMLDFLNRWL